MTKFAFLFLAALMADLGTAHAFGKKAMNVSELTGNTEAQVVKAAGTEAQLKVMVRGKAAELLFKTLKERREERVGSDALAKVAKAKASHWTVHGRQVTCSRISGGKKQGDDYACAFDLSRDGSLQARTEPFTPGVFNLALTKGSTKLFRKERGLASAQPVAFDKISAYVMYGKEKQKTASEEALLVFRGQAAAEIHGFLKEHKLRTFTMGAAEGRRGREISCVQATASQTERCALVVSLESGEVSTTKNPLF